MDGPNATLDNVTDMMPYFAEVVAPWSGVLCKIPDSSAKATTLKSTQTTKTYTVPGSSASPITVDLLVVSLPHSPQRELRIYGRLSANGPFGYLMSIVQDQDISLDYISARLVSSGYQIRSGTIASGQFAVNGTITAADFAQLINVLSANPSAILAQAISDLSRMINEPLAAGVVMCARPTADNSFWVPLPDTSTIEVVDPLALGPQLILSGSIIEKLQTQDVEITRQAPAEGASTLVTLTPATPLFGYFKLQYKLRWVHNTAANTPVNIQHIFTTQVCDPTTFAVTNPTAVINVTSQSAVSDGTNAFVYVEYEEIFHTNADLVSVGVNLRDFVVVPVNDELEIEVRLTSLSTYDLDAGQNGSVALLAGLTSGQQIAIAGTHHYEVVPNASLARNLKPFFSQEHPYELQVTKFLLSRPELLGLRTVSTIDAYIQMVSHLARRFPTGGHLVGYAATKGSIWANLWNHLKGVIKNVAPMALTGLGAALQGVTGLPLAPVGSALGNLIANQIDMAEGTEVHSDEEQEGFAPAHVSTMFSNRPTSTVKMLARRTNRYSPYDTYGHAATKEETPTPEPEDEDTLRSKKIVSLPCLLAAAHILCDARLGPCPHICRLRRVKDHASLIEYLEAIMPHVGIHMVVELSAYLTSQTTLNPVEENLEDPFAHAYYCVRERSIVNSNPVYQDIVKQCLTSSSTAADLRVSESDDEDDDDDDLTPKIGSHPAVHPNTCPCPSCYQGRHFRVGFASTKEEVAGLEPPTGPMDIEDLPSKAEDNFVQLNRGILRFAQAHEIPNPPVGILRNRVSAGKWVAQNLGVPLREGIQILDGWMNQERPQHTLDDIDGLGYASTVAKKKKKSREEPPAEEKKPNLKELIARSRAAPSAPPPEEEIEEEEVSGVPADYVDVREHVNIYSTRGGLVMTDPRNLSVVAARFNGKSTLGTLALLQAYSLKQSQHGQSGKSADPGIAAAARFAYLVNKNEVYFGTIMVSTEKLVVRDDASKADSLRVPVYTRVVRNKATGFSIHCDNMLEDVSVFSEQLLSVMCDPVAPRWYVTCALSLPRSLIKGGSWHAAFMACIIGLPLSCVYTGSPNAEISGLHEKLAQCVIASKLLIALNIGGEDELAMREELEELYYRIGEPVVWPFNPALVTCEPDDFPLCFSFAMAGAPVTKGAAEHGAKQRSLGVGVPTGSSKNEALTADTPVPVVVQGRTREITLRNAVEEYQEMKAYIEGVEFPPNYDGRKPDIEDDLHRMISNWPIGAPDDFETFSHMLNLGPRLVKNIMTAVDIGEKFKKRITNAIATAQKAGIKGPSKKGASAGGAVNVADMSARLAALRR